jgi:hypothetical protein
MMLPASTPLLLGRGQLVHPKLKLAGITVAQSFAVDETAGQAYAAQVSVGGERAGHLTITRLDWATGRVTGTMRLRGFGHGVAIGVESNPASTLKPKGCWLWVETGPLVRVSGSARGTRIVRLAFVPGRTVTCSTKGKLTAKTSAGKKVTPAVTILQPPGKRCTPSIDGDTLGLRWWDGDRYLWAAYDLATARKGKLDRLTTPRPLKASGLFQGWCLHGSQAYCMLGRAGQAATVAVLDLLTGSTTRHPTGVHESGYTEPEGIAVVGGRIHIGTATGRVGARRLTIHQL